MRAEDASLWNEPLEAQKLMRERQSLEEGIASVRGLTQALEDNIGLIELGEEEGDEGVIAEAEAALRSMQGEAKARQVETLLSGEARNTSDTIVMFPPGPPKALALI